MLVLFFWLLFAAVVGWLAYLKGRSAFGLFLISIIFSPIIGLITVLIMKPSDEIMEQRSLLSGEGKICPFCAEVVRSEAVTCKHCGKDIPADSPPSINAE